MLTRSLRTAFSQFFTLFCFVSQYVENTRTVSRNLGCKKTNDEVRSENRVDVLIPDIIQVLISSALVLL